MTLPPTSPDRDLSRRVDALLPKRMGHFVFESGHHGRLWLDLERLFLQPGRVRPLVEELALRLRDRRVEAICGPLVEGAFVGLMLASSLGVPFAYSVPVRELEPSGLFPVSYRIPAPLLAELRGKRVAIANDAVNAGSAVRGTLDALHACGAEPVAIATLAVYGGAAAALAAKRGVVLESLAAFSTEIFEPADCPLCAAHVAIDPV